MSRYEEIDWYDAPQWYDIVIAEDTDAGVCFSRLCAGALRPIGGPPSPGAGVWQRTAGGGYGGAGYRVSGFDRNPQMLRYARERLIRADLAAALSRRSMDDFRYGRRFDLAHCLVSTFKYLPDEACAAGHLECVADALAPGGVYVLGFHLTDYTWVGRTRERWVGERNGTGIVCNIQIWPADRRRRTAAVRSRLLVTERGRTRRYETHWTFRTYDEKQVIQLLKRVAAFDHLESYDFTYRSDRPIMLDGMGLDVVLILRRR